MPTTAPAVLPEKIDFLAVLGAKVKKLRARLAPRGRFHQLHADEVLDYKAGCSCSPDHLRQGALARLPGALEQSDRRVAQSRQETQRVSGTKKRGEASRASPR